MRIAFCLSGHMRTFQATIPTQLQNIIRPNKCDVFLSTWNVLGHGKHDRSDRAEFQLPLDQSLVTDLFGDSLKGFVVHDPKLIGPELKQCFYPGMVSMCWQIREADRLRQAYEVENDFHYDLIFRCRPDLQVNSSLQVLDFRRADGYIFTRWIDETNMDDQFAFGGNREMSIYANLYDYLEEYDALKLPGTNNGGPWVEQIFKHHILRNGLALEKVIVLSDLFRGDHDYC